jgi:hypothetical protein
MKNIERIAEELFDKIRSRFEHVVLGNEKTDETDDPEQARFFNFDYISDAGNNYGNITLSLIDEDSLKIYFSKNLTDKLAEDEVEQQQWYNFLKGLRFFAKRNLLTFDTRDISRSNLTLRDLKQVSKATSAYTANEVPVIESRMHGSSRISIQEFGPVRLIVHHSEAVNEEVPGARSRKIDSMFVETNLGERFRMPFKKLSAGRAMAEHISHGGYVHDDAGQHIVSMVEEMSNLSFFVRNTKHRMFEDTETQQMVEAAIERYQTLRTDLKRMSGPRGYQQFAETFQPEDPMEEDYDFESLKDRFVKKMFDDRLADALPYVHRAHKQRQTAEKNQYFKEFDEWADDITDRKPIDEDVDVEGIAVLMQKPLEVGIDGIDAINSVKDFIPSNDELFNKITQLSRDYGNKADARPTVDAWLVANGYPSVYVEEPAEEPAPENPELGSMKRLAGI